jgi:hypothetical protein
MSGARTAHRLLLRAFELDGVLPPTGVFSMPC